MESHDADLAVPNAEVPAAAAEADSPNGEAVAAATGAPESESSGPSDEEREAAEAAVHADSAREAQERVDADVASGDYAAAAQERETAENEAWEGQDSSMLHGRDSGELETAADYHERADRAEAEEAEHARAGDYEAARDDASCAAEAQDRSDFKAGGADHTGQADAEHNKEDWAVWEEGQAKDAHENAEWYAERGDLDRAESYEKSAESHQEWADQYGQEGEHGASGAVWDSSPESSSYDSSSYDSSADSSSSE